MAGPAPYIAAATGQPVTLEEALAGSGIARREAQTLAAHALGATQVQIIAGGGAQLSAAQSSRLAALFARRRQGEPVAYIVGVREFFSLEFEVTPAVLIPRPETELLVEFALARSRADVPCRVLDLGTGSGCVAIAIARHRPLAAVTAVDRSADALAVARANVERHAVDNVELALSDWFSALGGRRFDVIVANPPYVAANDPHLSEGDLRYEPHAALIAGEDGLACIRVIAASASRYLAGEGWLAFEHGYDQAERCRLLLLESGYRDVFSQPDLAGIERIAGGREPLRKGMNKR